MALKPDSKILNNIKKLIKTLAKQNIHIEKAYLFGSYANGTSKEYSDIDLALVSKNFKGNRFLDKQIINPISLKIDSRFEIHPYKTEEFNENVRWFTKEITEHGIEIMP